MENHGGVSYVSEALKPRMRLARLGPNFHTKGTNNTQQTSNWTVRNKARCNQPR